jgi:cytochrome c oxidase subunit 4
MSKAVQNNSGHGTQVSAAVDDGHQQHPLKTYFVVWGWLFVLSAGSYMVDYIGFEGYLRWTLILFFMMVKASLIIAFFMHLKWERLALSYAVILPPIVVLVFVGIMMFESDYTMLTRTEFFGAEP